jgi:3-hydroxyisobutyrate dehydrogenase
MTTSGRSDKQRIGFIGLGSMGAGMAARLAESGYEIAVYNRTRSKSEALEALGARVADSPEDAARDADVVMLSLADQHVVSSMLYGSDGAAAGLRAGGYIVDMSTVPPDFARELAAKASEEGHRALDACVLGAPQHARTGELRVMVGGSEADLHAVEDILSAIGKQVTYLGPNGLGATMKLVLNMLMGVQMPALAEAVVFGERAGLPREKILEMIAESGYSSPVMRFRCPMMGRRSFGQAAFKLSLMRKDMMLVLGQAQELGVPLPVSESAYSMLTAATQQGLGDLDVAAIVAFQERLAGMDDYPWPEAEETGFPHGPPS